LTGIPENSRTTANASLDPSLISDVNLAKPRKLIVINQIAGVHDGDSQLGFAWLAE